jgi:LysR family transcriptional regulator, nod-box dependent transcriptional activator
LFLDAHTGSPPVMAALFVIVRAKVISWDQGKELKNNAAHRAISDMNLNRLDLNLLVALDALLTERSITHAAERLNLSPSATSGALARLRTYFSDELLTQIGRRMAPTPLGESLQDSVRDCLLHVQATIDIRPQFDPLNSKRNFRLMMSDYVSTVLMPAALRRLQQEAPGITIELIANENEPWEALSRGEVDFLVLPKNFIREGHPAEVLFEDEYVCVCWSGNPLVADRISMEQCLQLGHVVARIGTVRPPTIDAWFFERFGHARHVEVIATNFNSVPHLLVGTNRISIMHRRLALVYAAALPLKILPSPVEMPRLVEMVQWHKYRDKDPGRIWLFDVLKSSGSAA